jgi:hypothetical protein
MALTLQEALKSGRLPEFIAQEETRDLNGHRDAFASLIESAVKLPQSADQISVHHLAMVQPESKLV